MMDPLHRREAVKDVGSIQYTYGISDRDFSMVLGGMAVGYAEKSGMSKADFLKLLDKGTGPVDENPA